MIIMHAPRFLLPLLLLAAWSMHALAGTELDNWRIEMVQVRGLAENDIPKAYQKVQRLQFGMPTDATPADRGRLLNLLARIALYRGESTAVDLYTAQALELAVRHDDRIGQAETNLIISLNAVNQSQFDRMEAAIHHSMEKLEGSDRKDLLVEPMLRTCMMYLRFGLLDESTAMAMKALEVAKLDGNPLALTYAHQGMAIVYDKSRNHTEAREHYKMMLGYAQDANSRLLEADAMLGLGGTLLDLGDVASGGRLLQDAVNIYRKAGGPFYTAHALNRLANYQHMRKEFSAALASLDEAAQIYDLRQNKVGLWGILQTRSEVFEAINKLYLSQANAERAYKLAREMGVAHYLGESARRLATLSAKRGNYKQAYLQFSEADEMAKKSLSEKSRKRISNLAQKFEEESKQRKIEELNRHAERQHAQQLQLLIMLAGAASLLAVMAFFLLRLRKSRAEIRTLNAELEQRVLERTAELFDSQQSLAEAQRIAHVGSWKNNLLDNVLTWSEEVYRIFEIDPQQFGASYEAFMELVHPDDRGMLDNAFKVSLENREPFEIEHRLLLPDGRIKYVHEHCETSYTADGRPLRSIGTVQEITERKEMENALYESRQLMAQAQRIAKVGSWEYDIATDTHTWSDELFRIYEIDPETEGASYEGCMSVTHPDDREAISNAYLKAVETGQPYESEHRLQMKDGRIKYVHERGETVCGPDGVLLRAVGMMQDITARKLAEQKLKEALEFSEGIVNAIPDILFEMDREGRYLNVWAQNAELLATQRELLVGKTVHEVLSPENAVAAMEAIREADEKGYAQGKDILIELPHNRRWFAHTLSKKLGGAPGEATFLALSRDITERKELEEVLAERERELRALAESSPGMMGSYYLKPDGKICMPYTSPNIYEQFGVRSEDVAEDATALLNLTHPEDVQHVIDTITESARTMSPWRCEYRILHPLKGERWMEGHTNPQPHPDGGTIWYGYVHDTTERKLFEQKLKEALEFTEGVINAIPDILFEIDGNGRYLNIWTHKPELLAAQKEVLLGHTVNEMLPYDAAATLMESLREAGENGVSFGKTIAIDLPEGMTWFELSVSKKANGAYLVLSRDISVRKRLEAELIDSHNFLGSVIDAVPDPIFVKDRKHRWILLNEANCKFTGMSRDTLIGKSDYDIFPKKEADVFWEKDELVFESGEVNLNEESFTSADGVTHHIQTKKTPFVSADGSQMLVGVIRDITERIQYESAREAALAEAQRLANLRSEFIAHMSHELRTPLNGILGYAQILARDDALDDKQQASVEVIRHSGEHLLALIEDILDLARIESGRLEFDFSDIPLGAFLNGVAGMVMIRAKEKQIDFLSDFSDDLPQGVRGDEKRLRQVLLNLLSNAVKFTDQGHVILTVCRVSPTRLSFKVADTGIGIAAADRENLFKSFEQVSDRQHRIGGTGLGLSISRQLVWLMGSDIEFESVPGVGSTFHFELELPEVVIAPETLTTQITDMQPDDLVSPDDAAETLIAPPRAEMQELYRLAMLGNMRDINSYADHIAGLDARYIAFASHLKRLANNFRSKAILAFVKENLS